MLILWSFWASQILKDVVIDFLSRIDIVVALHLILFKGPEFLFIGYWTYGKVV